MTNQHPLTDKLCEFHQELYANSMMRHYANYMRRTPMTNQHPLTDEAIEEISDLYEDSLCYDYPISIFRQDMRAAADWQLEEVMRKVELKLNEWRIQGYVAGADACEDFFKEVMQELRPQQQEDN